MKNKSNLSYLFVSAATLLFYITIIPLADDQWCSIHTVLEEKQFWDIVSDLKKEGAQGILVMNIEKMVL